MVDVLNIIGEPIFNDRIVKIKTHTYNPYAKLCLDLAIRYKYSYSSRIYCRATVFSTSKEDWQWRRKTIKYQRCLEIIAQRSHLMKFNMNSMMWRLIATETLELPSKTMCRWHMTKLWLRWTLNGTLNRRKDTLIFVCYSICCWAFVRITNAWLSTPRIDCDTIAQRLQLLGEKFCDGAWDWIIQSAVADVSRCVKRDQCCIGKRLFEHFARRICTSIFCYKISIVTIKHSWAFKTASLRSRDTLSLLCRPVERISCHKMLVCSTLVIWVMWNFI